MLAEERYNTFFWATSFTIISGPLHQYYSEVIGTVLVKP